MIYQLSDELSFCQVEGHLIFLDIKGDRYFRLSDRLERIFIASIEGNVRAEFDLAPLLARNLITEAPAGSVRVPQCSIKIPKRSALEQTDTKAQVSFTAMLDVFAIVLLTWVQLKTRTLKEYLDALVNYRRRRTNLGRSIVEGLPQQRLLDAAAVFRQARLYVPIETCCLIDSLALARFLARRGLHANIVIGVTGDPFGGHCWVQSSDFILNDTVGNASSHTPIRVA